MVTSPEIHAKENDTYAARVEMVLERIISDPRSLDVYARYISLGEKEERIFHVQFSVRIL